MHQLNEEVAQLDPAKRLEEGLADSAAFSEVPYQLCVRFWLLLSMERRDRRGAETIWVLERISSRPAEPLASRARGYSRGSSGAFLF